MMKRLPATLFVIILITVSIRAETVDEIVSKNIEARGGMKALQAVESVRIVGTLLIQGMGLPYTLEWKRPDKLRFAFETHGNENVQAFDGSRGWSITPHMGSEPNELTNDELSRLRRRTDYIEGDLVNYRSKGHRVKFVGREVIDGRDAFKLQLTREGGDVSYLYIDAEHYVVFRKESKIMLNGRITDVVTSIGDYRKVGDLLFAHSIESTIGTGGAHGTQAFVIDSITLNAEIDDSQFEMPR